MGYGKRCMAVCKEAKEKERTGMRVRLYSIYRRNQNPEKKQGTWDLFKSFSQS
jgi:hypothetical protein